MIAVGVFLGGIVLTSAVFLALAWCHRHNKEPVDYDNIPEA